MRPFENPGKLANDPRGMTYGKAAVLAGGTLAIAYYIAMRRDTRQLPTQTKNADLLRPDGSATTQQVATNREQQQHRKPPPTKKSTQDERA